MPYSKLLFAWIGHADLLAMARDLGDSQKDRVLRAINARQARATKEGPIKTLLDREGFEKTHLLSNYQPFLILLYWVIGVDETSLEARGYVLDGDRIVQARCV